MEGENREEDACHESMESRLYMKPVLTKEWQTDITKAQSAQRDKDIKTYRACQQYLSPIACSIQTPNLQH
jgi:hypothetical protein